MKVKNIKKKIKHLKFPSNFRTIPAFKLFFPKFTSTTFLRTYRVALKIFIVLIFILAVVIVGLDLASNIKAKQEIDLERKKLTNELMFWENFIVEHHNYKDAYFQASVLEFKLGDTSKARMYVEKGLALDSNSQDGRKIEEFLSK